MKKKTNRILLISLIILILAVPLTACQSTAEDEVEEDSPIQVTVSILPLSYFVERIGSDLVTINVMVGPGEEAHTYEPTTEQMTSLSDSLAFFSIGVEYENTWLPRFEETNPDMLVVDSSDGIERIPMTNYYDQAEDETSSDEDDQKLDPHVWLSPENGKIIAENILLTLKDLSPEHEEDFQANYEDLISDIDELDQQIESLFEGVEQRTFMVFHPAWGYFADQYDLVQIAVQVDGQDPSVSEMADLVEIGLEENIKVIFVQPTFNSSDAEAIAEEIGAEIALINPLSEDWLSNLEVVAEAFAAAIKD